MPQEILDALEAAGRPPINARTYASRLSQCDDFRDDPISQGSLWASVNDAQAEETLETLELFCPDVAAQLEASKPIPAASTTSPALDPDLSGLLILGDLRDGEAPAIGYAFIEIVEPDPLVRVDVMSAILQDDTPVELVVVGTSGWASDDRQLEATVDALVALAALWDESVEIFYGAESLAPGLSLEVDGRQFNITYDELLDINARRLSPRDALGL